VGNEYPTPTAGSNSGERAHYIDSLNCVREQFGPSSD